MVRRVSLGACLAGCLALAALVLGGCADSGEYKASKQEQEAFAGKPMPPEVANYMQQSGQRSAQARQQAIQKSAQEEAARRAAQPGGGAGR